MHSPLKEFAERLTRNGEVATFIQGLILEHQVQGTAIICAVRLAEQAKANSISNSIDFSPQH